MSNEKLYDEVVADQATNQWLNPQYQVAATNRFNLASSGFGILDPWVKRVRYSLKPNSSLDIKWYDIKTPEGTTPLRDYLLYMLNPENTDSFVLTNYDDAGVFFGKVSFEGCRLVDHFVEFDSFDSSSLCHKMVFTFDRFEFN